MQNFRHQPLKNSWGTGQTIWHGSILILAVRSDKGHFPACISTQRDLMKARFEIELGNKAWGSLASSIEEILAARQREHILAHYVVQPSEVNTQTQ